MNVKQASIIRTLVDGISIIATVGKPAHVLCKGDIKTARELQQDGLIKVFCSPANERFIACEYAVARRDAECFVKAGWTELYVTAELDFIEA